MVSLFDMEMFYQMECCGDLPTRQGKINKLINILAESDNPWKPATQAFALAVAGLSTTTLSYDEQIYVEREVSKRRCL